MNKMPPESEKEKLIREYFEKIGQLEADILELKAVIGKELYDSIKVYKQREKEEKIRLDKIVKRIRSL